MNELFFSAILCAFIFDGDHQSRQHYQVGHDVNFVKIDCRTDTHAIEVGFDKRSSYDSLHQVAFAAHLTGLEPMIVIIDTDGRERAAEYQIKTMARENGIAYRVYDRDFLIRWQMTRYLRSYRATPPNA